MKLCTGRLRRFLYQVLQDICDIQKLKNAGIQIWVKGKRSGVPVFEYLKKRWVRGMGRKVEEVRQMGDNKNGPRSGLAVSKINKFIYGYVLLKWITPLLGMA